MKAIIRGFLCGLQEDLTHPNVKLQDSKLLHYGTVVASYRSKNIILIDTSAVRVSRTTKKLATFIIKEATLIGKKVKFITTGVNVVKLPYQLKERPIAKEVDLSIAGLYDELNKLLGE